MTRLFSCLVLVLVLAPAQAGNDDKNDPKEWTPIEIRGHQAAPEFAGITDWINSGPLKMSELKGKVVVVHFLAFG